MAGLMLLTACAADLQAGTIRGRVDVQLELPPIEPRPNVADLGMAGPRDTPDRSRSVVYLETAPQGAFEELRRPPAHLDQRNEAFVPYVLPITVGTSVIFLNNDRTYHNVFSLSKVKRFDLGRYARGESRSVRFDRPGEVRVFCDIHSHMSAFILVFAHPYFAVTDAEGRYAIEGVPPGTYTVMVWTDGRDRESRRIGVPEGDQSLSVDFVVK